MGQAEPDFPRGRGEPTPSSSQEATNKRKSKKRSKSLPKTSEKTDFLFGGTTSNNSNDNEQRLKRSRKSHQPSAAASSLGSSGSKSMLPIGGGGCSAPHNHAANSSSSSNILIEPLSFNKLSAGFKLLAVVKEVHPDLAIFSLPNLWTAYTLRENSETQPPLDQQLVVNQVLAVQIVKAVSESASGSSNNKQQPQRRRRIQVTVRPDQINPKATVGQHPDTFVRGRIVSVEDHGLLVDLGLKRRGFLPFADIEGDYTVEKETEEDSESNTSNSSNKRILTVQRLLDFVVRGPVQSDHIVPLKLPSPRHMAKLAPDFGSAYQPTLQELQPGTLIPHVTVEHTVRNGLAVAFGAFRGAIELPHIGAYWLPQKHDKKQQQQPQEPPWRAFFEQHRSFPARLLAVDPHTKIIRLTLLPHLLELRSSGSSSIGENLPATGARVEQCTVIRLDPGVGALLALPDDDEKKDTDSGDDSQEKPLFRPLSNDESYLRATRVKAVYVHISKAMDEDPNENGKVSESTFGKQFAPSTQHTVRILSTANLIEGIASGATAPSVVRAHVLTHADLVPGKVVYRQVPVCSQLLEGGILVDFGLGIRGLIPALHLFDQAVASDYRNQMRKVKYSVGAKVDVRVLTVDANNKKCTLTAKKSLVKVDNEEEQIITSFDDIQLGQKAVGFVSKVDDDGLFVTFFNGVFGRVTARSLMTELGVEDHKQNYSRGDVVQCRVVNLKKRSSRRNSRRWQEEDEDDEDRMEVDGTEENPEHRRRYYYELTLSLRLDGETLGEADGAPAEKEQPHTKIQLRAGAVLPLKSLRVVELVRGKGKARGFVPGYAIVSIKSKYMVGEAEAATMPPFIECKLPYDQLLDQYEEEDLQSVSTLDELAESMLTVGKKVNRKGMVLMDPHKSNSEYSSGTGTLAVVSVRPQLIETAEAQLRGEKRKTADENADDEDFFLPGPDSHMFTGATVQGYVAQIDVRHGAFVRFLDGLTGLVPKRGGGLSLHLFSTVVVKVLAVDDKVKPPRILLGLRKRNGGDAAEAEMGPPPLQAGDVIEEAEISKLDFHRANLKILDEAWSENRTIRARLHCSMAESKALTSTGKLSSGSTEQVISSCHPFYKWSTGDKLTDLHVLSVTRHGRSWIVEVTNRKVEKDSETTGRMFVEKSNELSPGDRVSGIVTAVAKNHGLWLQLSPSVSAQIPGLELSEDVNVLNNLARHFPLGSRLDCVVVDKSVWEKTRSKYHGHRPNKKDEDQKAAGVPLLSLLGCSTETANPTKPRRGDLIVGRIDRSLPPAAAPALMLDLRGGYVGRCCVTELEEVDEWTNFPLGRARDGTSESHGFAEPMDIDEDGEDERLQGNNDDRFVPKEDVPFAQGMFVQCRVLAGVPSKPLVEVSLRPSRIEGDCEDDEAPEVGETVHAYVVDTSKKGCFLRLGRQIEGRTILKELCDGFLPDPSATFPMGRLIVGKVKDIQPTTIKTIGFKFAADLDMRESTLVDDAEGRVKFDEIEIGDKYEGTVARIEDFGVFVRIENSDVSGLVHKSECSDNYIKNLADLYDPGDLVKLIVVKKNVEKKQLGFSMKASHFEGDEDLEDDSSASDDSSAGGSQMLAEAEEDNFGLDSDDENFAAKLASKMSKTNGSDDDDASADGVDDSSDSSSESDSSENESDDEKAKEAMDTNVGFDWNGGLSSSKRINHVSDEDSDSSEDEDDEEGVQKSSHKSRKKQAQRRREEEEITRRETALADGTADENPETAADFERLIAGDPNSSELWIRYMAFHLTLANVQAAREVANRAFLRIEFRQETEKLNVWCALLTLELKYGSEESLQETLNRACQHNNPKYVYLRMCEMMEKQSSSPDAVRKTDAMFSKMCKKFKDKKKVWIAHMDYMLKNARHEEAFALSKRALLSLKPHKHVETMSKFAQLVFEYGSAEKARTIFDGLLLKYPKRLDLFFVYADKEVKHGKVDAARSLFARVANPGDETLTLKLSDRQMKRFFKKWFCFEETHGTEATQERVKDAARQFVERSAL